MHIHELDIIFLSYDEPNAEKHWADLTSENKAPWAKRVHGVLGFDAAHRAAANEAETDWLITVDADNIVRPEFFDLNFEDNQVRLHGNTHVTLDDRTNCISWNGLNAINGLSYGNGGLKLWRKAYLAQMASHELSSRPDAIDFCWETGYHGAHQTYSDVWNNGSAYQAFRVGFREGVKLAVNRGERVRPEMMKTVLHPVNLRNLRIWSSVGAHVEHGLWAVYGALLGWHHMCDMTWDHSVVRDFEWFKTFWDETSAPVSVHGDPSNYLETRISQIAMKIHDLTKIIVPSLSSDVSSFFRDMMAHHNV